MLDAGEVAQAPAQAVVESRAVPHDRRHHDAGRGGAGALRGAFPEHTLHEAFAAGLNSAAGVAGCVATAAGVLVLALVSAPGGVTKAPARTLTEEEAAHRN
ncbi:hypothetical protein [Streptomyces sp. DG2A-72]|uniref:hypothetical protein n=1 Tax=Streptomyces sp. DG2A-72 TaxID=3051386 RepID=UPI003463BF7C